MEKPLKLKVEISQLKPNKMPQLNHTDPESKGGKTGRKLGRCNTDSDRSEYEFGQGMGEKRNSGNSKGLGKRLRSSKLFFNK